MVEPSSDIHGWTMSFTSVTCSFVLVEPFQWVVYVVNDQWNLLRCQFVEMVEPSSYNFDAFAWHGWTMPFIVSIIHGFWLNHNPVWLCHDEPSLIYQFHAFAWHGWTMPFLLDTYIYCSWLNQNIVCRFKEDVFCSVHTVTSWVEVNLYSILRWLNHCVMIHDFLLVFIQLVELFDHFCWLCFIIYGWTIFVLQRISIYTKITNCSIINLYFRWG